MYKHNIPEDLSTKNIYYWVLIIDILVSPIHLYFVKIENRCNISGEILKFISFFCIFCTLWENFNGTHHLI